ncbi:MAG TPA: Crp/Fnr family transcriptional regulator [Cytophagales bacterium]|jgi:CRP/FNR family cyclic AMP-dependent transcriptional regulator|nr:Crp/Fnr family transcriptional regulator [Cytophagales bacterium]
MIIPEEILSQFNAQFQDYSKDDYIFYEDEPANYYYQVITGSVKMSSYSLNGQEFIQGVFKPRESFGEPAIFGDFLYPNNAIAMEDCQLARLPKDIFFEILKKHFEIHLKFSHIMSNRLRYKAVLLKGISSYCPDPIILTLLRYMRESSGHSKSDKYQAPYTRQHSRYDRPACRNSYSQREKTAKGHERNPIVKLC